jgi:hypothetical protein
MSFFLLPPYINSEIRKRGATNIIKYLNIVSGANVNVRETAHLARDFRLGKNVTKK